MPVNVVSYTPPAGNIAPALNNGKFNATFGTTAVFGGAPIANGEYRQYVMGSFVANGSQLTHYLCAGDPMLTNAYKEDGCLATCTAYGHRTCPADPIDRYLPTQLAGANYSMSDSPGFNNVSPGVTYVVTLSFKGDLIDTSAAPGTAPMRTATWTVNGQVTVPAQATTTASKPSPQGLQSGDRVVSAHFAINLDTKAWEVHVVVTRSQEAPPIDPSRVPFVLRSDADDLIEAANVSVYEIADKSASTASVVYTLDPKQKMPFKVQLGSNMLDPGLAIGSHA